MPDPATVVGGQLSNPIAEVRQEALYALASLEARALTQLPALLAEARAGEIADRQLAVWVIAHLISRCGNLISDDDASRISEALSDAIMEDDDNDVRETAANALVLLGPREQNIIPQLVAALGRSEVGSTSGDSIGDRYLRAALLQYGYALERCW